MATWDILWACPWPCIRWPQLKARWSGGHSPACLAAQLGDCCSQDKGMCQISQICTCRRSTRPVRQHPAIQLLAGTHTLWVILQWGRHSSWKEPSPIPQAHSKNPKWAAVSIGKMEGAPKICSSEDLEKHWYHICLGRKGELPRTWRNQDCRSPGHSRLFGPSADFQSQLDVKGVLPFLFGTRLAAQKGR